jgi:hypothetical protein
VGLSTALTAAIIAVGIVALHRQPTITPVQAEESPAVLSVPEKVGKLDLPQVPESSGLTRSFANPGRLWTHNDSGDGPELYLFDPAGTLYATATLQGATNTDWEDITSFADGDHPKLLVADTGDNLRRRDSVTLWITDDPVADAHPTQDTIGLPVVRRITITYADGPRDCEAVAVDPASRQVVFISKELDQTGKTHGPSGVYLADLDGPDSQTLNRVADLPLTLATAMDVTADGRRAILATYGNGYLWERRDGECWSQAFTREPATVTLPPRGLGESIAWSADGKSVYLTSEGIGKPVWWVPVN